MRFGTRVWSVGKFFLLVAALTVTFLISFGISMRVALRTREVEVPTLTGLTVNEATERLATLGLGLRVDDNRRADPKVPLGRVMQQEPNSGTRARRQRTIRVWVSSGPRVTTVPALVGQTERTARIRLDQDGVQIGTLHFPLSTAARPGNGDRRVQVLFRPEDVALAATEDDLAGPALGQAEVEQITFVGSFERLRLRLPPAT